MIDQVQQVSLAQKGTKSKMDCLKKGVEAKMDGMEAKMNVMDAKIDGMDDKMEELKINMNKLLQEMVTNGERVVKETHDENKKNVNHDFIDSNIGSKKHHVPKIDMRKFDGKDPGTWILQMEQFLDLHNVKNTQIYAFKLYIWIQINLYGIDGFALVNKLSLGICLRMKR